jgi:UBX domain-containing protein 1
MVERTLHLWEDGFSIDDGPLFRYDDPRNRHTLEMINRGSAPLDLMDVEPGQAVDVRLDEHRGEKYVQPKKKYTPFGGSGQRLGSPVPGEASAAKPATKTTTTSSAASSASSSGPQTMNVDDAQPTISLQIRLGDGSRLVSRFNTTHTIGDVYDFVSRANPGSSARSYVLAATFPTKDLTDKAQVLGEMAEYKRGGVIVQKWT